LIASFAAATLLIGPVAVAADSAQAEYQAHIQYCTSNPPDIDRQACMREAGAALEAARRAALTTPSTDATRADRTQRCNALPGERRQECLTLMESPDTRIQGSVESGGILRETTITVPASTVN
jgi:hypothetical protein